MSADEDLKLWIQENVKFKVTTNTLTILRKLASKNKGNLENFKRSCQAIGKFNDSDEFLPCLLKRLNSDQLVTEQSPINPEPLAETSIKRRKIKLSLDFEDGNDEDEPETAIPFVKRKIMKTLDKAPIFKKLAKNEAMRLKEFSPVKIQPKESNDSIKRISSQLPKTKANQQLNRYEQKIDNVESKKQFVLPNRIKEEPLASDILRNSDITTEDQEWYNYDDDYGNLASDDVELIQEVAQRSSFSRMASRGNKTVFSGHDTIHSDVQLTVIPINKRREWLPPFLKAYVKSQMVSSSMVLGSLTEDSHSYGLVNAFRNPESEFSQNARKPSKLITLRRLRNDQNEKSKETADVAGTHIGDVLGIKKSDASRNKADHEPDTSSEEKDQETTEDVEETRKSLPVYKVRSQLLQLIRENQVMIIIGETGSGKTTQLAQYLYEDGFCNDGRLIGCTQPRRVAAMSVAKRVSTEMHVELGQEVGYSIRFEDLTSPNTLIKYMTDGILLRETLLDDTLEKYSCIIIDEAHERSLNTDVLMGIFKTVLKKRTDLKIIITSATMNASKFSNFFGKAPLFTIPGRTFPVQVIYSKFPPEDYVEAAVTETVKIHLSTPIDSGDILIFMTGQEDIETTCDVIKEKLLQVYIKKYGISKFSEINDLEILPIYSALPAHIQSRIFRSTDNNKRKIVVATNIAETSLTIAGIRYVIDTGLSKLKVYNPKIGLDSLAITPIAQANANQRSGRAGRTGPGIAYRLYTEESFDDDMYVQAIPEIQRTNLSNTVLLLKSLSVSDVLKFPFIDPPPLQTLLTSLYELWSNGALDNKGCLTPLGKEMAKFPLQPSLSKILLVSAQNGCSEEMLTIVSMLSVPQVFHRPNERQEESDLARSRFFIPESDHLSLLNVYGQWRNNNFSSSWCKKHFLQYKSLVRAHDIRTQLATVMEKQGIQLVSSGSDWNIIRKCICVGFSHQAAKISGLGKYIHLRTGMDVQIHPTSALFGLGDLPPYVVYHELLMTSKEYLCCVTSVDPFWLMESGFLLYDIRRMKTDKEMNPRTYGEYDIRDDDQKGEDNLDLAIKNCIKTRNEFIKILDDDNSGKIVNESDPSISSRLGKKTETNSMFKRRRPL
ncbi:hypothetical protein NCAS_0A03280 [Naumovozyma castellii]|uniref:Pre-mRNA-splicing factor ATP-dependent RNA helicase PRP16 n=1 Tax=Naumovozyma castellii TaxID=27288 RepID=G0V5Z6_NAUCA|nr:hypothetical protein NCAS_0A03280 [Naumovozyma castellii CBS 4309]CCC66886.1 hypothetical protein NCAS_0A03280 [Naumovozyma castellii CBS 4309]